MTKHALPALSLFALALAASPALAAPAQQDTSNQQTAENQSSQNGAGQTWQKNQPGEQRADQDFGRVSRDGFAAMHDVTLARWAIFDGNTNDAKQFVSHAAAELSKAETDNTKFMKAEADLKPGPGQAQPNSNENDQASTQPTEWLPVDGSVAVAENYMETPDKSANIAKANQQMKEGNSEGAKETLRLAGVDVVLNMEVAPLKKTEDGVTKAEQLLNQGQYYQANLALKSVQDGIRYDVVDMSGNPRSGNGKTAADNSSRSGEGNHEQSGENTGNSNSSTHAENTQGGSGQSGQ
jgi:hypothetical protein